MERSYTFNQLIEISRLAKAWVKPSLEVKEDGIIFVRGRDPINGKRIVLKYKTLADSKKPKQKREVCIDGINCPICRRKLIGR